MSLLIYILRKEKCVVQQQQHHLKCSPPHLLNSVSCGQ